MREQTCSLVLKFPALFYIQYKYLHKIVFLYSDIFSWWKASEKMNMLLSAIFQNEWTESVKNAVNYFKIWKQWKFPCVFANWEYLCKILIKLRLPIFSKIIKLDKKYRYGSIHKRHHSQGRTWAKVFRCTYLHLFCAKNLKYYGFFEVNDVYAMKGEGWLSILQSRERSKFFAILCRRL